MSEETTKIADGSDRLDELVRSHFYWVEGKHEGWQPAQYSGFENGKHMFLPIGMDYEFDFFTYFKGLGDEIIRS